LKLKSGVSKLAAANPVIYTFIDSGTPPISTTERTFGRMEDVRRGHNRHASRKEPRHD